MATKRTARKRKGPPIQEAPEGAPTRPGTQTKAGIENLRAQTITARKKMLLFKDESSPEFKAAKAIFEASRGRIQKIMGMYDDPYGNDPNSSPPTD